MVVRGRPIKRDRCRRILGGRLAGLPRVATVNVMNRLRDRLRQVSHVVRVALRTVRRNVVHQLDRVRVRRAVPVLVERDAPAREVTRLQLVPFVFVLLDRRIRTVITRGTIRPRDVVRL